VILAEVGVDMESMRNELDIQMQRLDGELAELEKVRESARHDNDEHAGYGNHVGEAASETSNAERDRALIDKLEQMRKQVEAAIKRMEQGTYGDCASCGKPIPRERLEALPFADQCVSCKSASPAH
jgi:DnaK suppressor protein